MRSTAQPRRRSRPGAVIRCRRIPTVIFPRVQEGLYPRLRQIQTDPELTDSSVGRYRNCGSEDHADPCFAPRGAALGSHPPDHERGGTGMRSTLLTLTAAGVFAVLFAVPAASS